jgi:hypothetical protein
MLAMYRSAGSYVRPPLIKITDVRYRPKRTVKWFEIYGSVLRLSSCGFRHHVRPLPELRNFYESKKKLKKKFETSTHPPPPGRQNETALRWWWWNTGRGAVMLRPIRFQRDGVWTETILPYVYTHSSPYAYSVPTGANFDLHGTFRKSNYCLSRGMSVLYRLIPTFQHNILPQYSEFNPENANFLQKR